ncbi:hypothetical protein SCB29_35170, partial [Paraburkholderia sp. SIMBA_055]
VIPAIPRDVDGIGVVLRTVKDTLIAAAAIPVASLIAMLPFVGRSLAYIGQRTLPLYVMQLPILWMVILVRPRMPWGNGPFQIVSPFIGLAGIVVMALALHWLAMRTPARVMFQLPRSWARRIRGDSR